MTFPVIGAVSYSDSYLACRGTGCSRRHLGQDIMGRKTQHLVAVFSGTVTNIKRETVVGDGNYISVRSLDGKWTVNYLHVNNDTPGTDDGRGTAKYAILPGLKVGSKVVRGQLIGWLGDSGNAEGTGPHCHFELRLGDAWSGTVFNAYPSLRAAGRLTKAVTSAPHQPGELITKSPGYPSLIMADGGRTSVPPSMMAAYGWTADDIVEVNGAELSLYPYQGVAPLRNGSVVIADGISWATTGGRRYQVTSAQVNLMGLTVAGAVPVTASVLTGTPVGTGLPPGGTYRDGAFYKVSGDPQVWLIDRGQRHAVHQGTFPYWSIPAGQIATPPAGLPSPPAAGVTYGYKDGSIYRTTSSGTFMMVAGVRRQIVDPYAQIYYNWQSKRQFYLYDSVNAALPLGARIA